MCYRWLLGCCCGVSKVFFVAACVAMWLPECYYVVSNVFFMVVLGMLLGFF